MKKFFQNAFTKIKDYFTVNLGRKIFFYGLLSTILCLLVLCFNRHVIVLYGTVLAALVACAGSLADIMQRRMVFLKKIREMQYEHLQQNYADQMAGRATEMTPTFTDDEKKYLRRRKWNFVLLIIFHVAIIIALFSLLSVAQIG